MRKELDRMAEIELSQRRLNEVVQGLGLVLVMTVTALVATIVAQDVSGLWLITASILWVGSVASFAILVWGSALRIRSWYSRRKRKLKNH